MDIDEKHPRVKVLFFGDYTTGVVFKNHIQKFTNENIDKLKSKIDKNRLLKKGMQEAVLVQR